MVQLVIAAKDTIAATALRAGVTFANYDGLKNVCIIMAELEYPGFSAAENDMLHKEILVHELGHLWLPGTRMSTGPFAHIDKFSPTMPIHEATSVPYCIMNYVENANKYLLKDGLTEFCTNCLYSIRDAKEPQGQGLP